MNAAVKAAHEAIDRKDVRAYWRHVASYSLLQGMVRDWRHVVLSEIRTLPGPPRLDFVDRLRVGLDDLYRAFK